MSILLAMFAVLTPCRAQDGPELLPQPSESGRNALLDVVPLVPTPSLSLGGGVAANLEPLRTPAVDIWIISSRHCPQPKQLIEWGNPVTPPARCDLRFFRHQAAFRGTPRAFVQSNRAAFSQSLDPQAPLCLAVHGSFVSWNLAQRQAELAAVRLRAAYPNRPLQFVLFTWPSYQFTTALPSIDLGILGHRAGYNGFYLLQALACIPQTTPVCLVGHSHGCRVISSALHLIGGGEVYGHVITSAPPRHRLRAVYIAAAVDHDWLNPGNRFGRAVYPLESLLIMKNTLDLVLCLYPLRSGFGDTALSKTGLTRRDRRALGPLGRKITERGVALQVGPNHDWSHYFTQPQILTLFRTALYQ